jgi:hypothetical protein
MTKMVMRSERTPAGFVYVFAASNGYVKVGKASLPYERFSMACGASPLPLTLEYICECADPVDIEVAAHHALAAHHRHHEWFEVSTERAIEAIRSALREAGAVPMDAPHRAKKPNGARIVHRPTINEMAVAPV